jgi:hypothetical protein
MKYFNNVHTKFKANIRLFSTTEARFIKNIISIDTNMYTFVEVESDFVNEDKFKMDIDTNLSMKYLATKVTELLLPYYNEGSDYQITLILSAYKGCLTLDTTDFISKTLDNDLSESLRCKR